MLEDIGACLEGSLSQVPLHTSVTGVAVLHCGWHRAPATTTILVRRLCWQVQEARLRSGACEMTSLAALRIMPIPCLCDQSLGQVFVGPLCCIMQSLLMATCLLSPARTA